MRSFHASKSLKAQVTPLQHLIFLYFLQMTVREALGSAMADELERDSKVFIIGTIRHRTL